MKRDKKRFCVAARIKKIWSVCQEANECVIQNKRVSGLQPGEQIKEESKSEQKWMSKMRSSALNCKKAFDKRCSLVKLKISNFMAFIKCMTPPQTKYLCN